MVNAFLGSKVSLDAFSLSDCTELSGTKCLSFSSVLCLSFCCNESELELEYAVIMPSGTSSSFITFVPPVIRQNNLYPGIIL